MQKSMIERQKSPRFKEMNYSEKEPLAVNKLTGIDLTTTRKTLVNGKKWQIYETNSRGYSFKKKRRDFLKKHGFIS
jgi:hypothetical protein